ncbi:UNVERIFIED_CONTAM: hypothetical protein HDU68_006246 [Siphonaria sp. JEL0065]|nr:hypothetical protein HDU68_006246 [Siphonaria sp. JEL0065]
MANAPANYAANYVATSSYAAPAPVVPEVKYAVTPTPTPTPAAATPSCTEKAAAYTPTPTPTTAAYVPPVVNTYKPNTNLYSGAKTVSFFGAAAAAMALFL